MPPVQNISKLLVVALKTEWSHLKRFYKFESKNPELGLYKIMSHESCYLLQIGIGLERAERCFENFLKSYQPQNVLHFGCCGALRSGLSVADVCEVAFVSNGKERLELTTAGSSGFGLLSCLEPAMTPQKKEQLFTESRCDIVDMESFAVAKQCLKQGIHYRCVRSVFDTCEDDLTDLPQFLEEGGDVDFSQASKNLLAAPHLILKLPALKRRSDQLNQSLVPVIQDFLAS